MWIRKWVFWVVFGITLNLGTGWSGQLQAPVTLHLGSVLHKWPWGMKADISITGLIYWRRRFISQQPRCSVKRESRSGQRSTGGKNYSQIEALRNQLHAVFINDRALTNGLTTWLCPSYACFISSWLAAISDGWRSAKGCRCHVTGSTMLRHFHKNRKLRFLKLWRGSRSTLCGIVVF
jgi:hypothetical protein